MRQKNQAKFPIQLDFTDCQSMADFCLLLIRSTIECAFIRKLQSIEISKSGFLLDFLVQKCKFTISEMISAIFETFLVKNLSLNGFERGNDFTILEDFSPVIEAANRVLFDYYRVKMVKSSQIFWQFTLKRPSDPSGTHFSFNFKFAYFICPLIKLKTIEN